MKRLLLVLFFLLLVGIAIAKLLVFELPQVTGHDMAPALQLGDLLLAYRLSPQPQRGQLVLLEHPTGKSLLLRRVVGLPGERIAVREEVPVINGHPARREVREQVTLVEGDAPEAKKPRMNIIREEVAGTSYLVLKDIARRSLDVKELVIPRESYYVLADSRNHGVDSRDFGPVPRHKIRAIITHRLSAGAGSLEGAPRRPSYARLPE